MFVEVAFEGSEEVVHDVAVLIGLGVVLGDPHYLVAFLFGEFVGFAEVVIEGQSHQTLLLIVPHL